ncbi:MAG TPA: polysaccharide biosynthesis tyrosine autokinase, partial [Puia sp.]|nr:polysaccharide biosynthesis tyrosine autokinase [Puia sp.]
ELFMSQGVSNLSNEIEILKSKPVLQRVARDLNLQIYYYNKGNVKTSFMYPDPPFFLEPLSIVDSASGFNCMITLLGNGKFLLDENKTKLEFGEPFKVGNNLCRLTRNPAYNENSFVNAKFSTGWQPFKYAAENLAGGLSVSQANDQSTILTLAFEGENANLGNDVLNTLMSVYDSLIIEDKSRINANTLNFINTELYTLNDTLKGAQGGLRNYMVENQVFDLDAQSKNYLDNLKDVIKDRDEQEVRLNIIDWLLKYIADKKHAYDLVPTDLGVQEPALVPMIAEYNRLQLERQATLRTTPETNSLVVGMEVSLEGIRKEIYQALLNVKESYKIAGSKLESHEQELQNGIRSMPGKSIQLLNRQRQQRILEELYSLLLQKKLETQIASASTVSNSKVVEPAAGAGTEISPDRKKIYTLYILLGLLIPCAVIALIEVLRDKVTGRADVEKNTAAPILGEIGHSNYKNTLVVTKNSRLFISEQFRIIRTNLQYVIGKKEKPVIMVTSSFSGEGKSFISINIGAVMALADRKTVIMEFDIRKPKIVSGLELRRKMGITNYLIGSAKFEELVVKVDEVDNLYVIPCGPIPPNPSELLLDPRLDELMAEVHKRFDVIIMDTAPVGLVSDAVNLVRFADCTLYIVRQAYTFRRQINAIDELYTQKKLPKISLLLNDVKMEGGYYGGYNGGGYYGGYGYGGDSGYFENERGMGNGSIFRRVRAQLERWFG